jgi:tripartite-type tricarboxylate transporter receptor subunit TctC
MKRGMDAVCAAIICLLGFPFAAGAAIGQNYPVKPIRFVVGFPPGGTNDVLGRLFAQKLTDAWGQPVIVDNRPGASSIIATELVAKAPADGYTLLIGAFSQMIINPYLYPNLPYDPIRDFAPVTVLGSFALILGVHPSNPANSVKELIDELKAKPGQLNYGAPSVWFQLTTEMFKQMASVDMRHIPYKGSIQALSALMAGDVQVAFIDPPPIIPQVRAGKVKALAVTSLTRSPLYPDIPTVAESGLPGFEMVGWLGLFAPSGTQREIVYKLQEEIVRILQQPDIRKRMSAVDVIPGGSTPEQLAAQLKADITRYSAVMRAANMKAENE